MLTLDEWSLAVDDEIEELRRADYFAARPEALGAVSDELQRIWAGRGTPGDARGEPAVESARAVAANLANAEADLDFDGLAEIRGYAHRRLRHLAGNSLS
jgi:hypothetical protein